MQILKGTLWFSSVAACGGRGAAGRFRRRRSEQGTRWSETSIAAWARWVTQRSASWRSSSSWWCCGSHETRASWTAGRLTSSTPRPSEYPKIRIRVYIVFVSHTCNWKIKKYWVLLESQKQNLFILISTCVPLRQRENTFSSVFLYLLSLDCSSF